MKEEKIFSFIQFLITNPILTLICIMFFIGDIVLATCIVYDRIHMHEMIAFQNSYKELQKSRDRLSNMIESIQSNYDQVNRKLTRTTSMYKNLESQSQKNAKTVTSKLSSLKSDLHVCQNTNLKFISTISANNSTISSLKKNLQCYQKVTESMRKLFVRQLALKPTWIEAGGVLPASGYDFALVVDGPSDGNQCGRGSTVVNVMNGQDKKTLCVQMNLPARFNQGGDIYSVDLLGVRENDKRREYLVSILKGGNGS